MRDTHLSMKGKLSKFTKKEYEEVIARTEEQMKTMPLGVAFAFDEKSQSIRLNLDNNVSVIFPVTMLPALKNATPAQIRNVRFVSDGMDIWWDDLDVQHTVEYILGKATGTIAPPQKVDSPKGPVKRVGSKAALKKKTSPPKNRKKVAA